MTRKTAPRKMSATAMVIVALALLAGCGGGNGSFTAEEVSELMTASIREDLPAGATMDPLDCVREDGDRFRCLAYVRVGEELQTTALTVTCDPETGRCISVPG